MHSSKIEGILDSAGVLGTDLRHDLARQLHAGVVGRGGRRPLLLVSSQDCSPARVARGIHEIGRKFLSRPGPFIEMAAADFVQRPGPAVEETFRDSLGGTVHLDTLESLPDKSCTRLARSLHENLAVARGDVLLVASGEVAVERLPRVFSDLFEVQVQLPELFLRAGDLDEIIRHYVDDALAEVGIEDTRGLTLAAAAHIHRAVVQTRRRAGDLADLCRRIAADLETSRTSLEDGYVTSDCALPLLAEIWGYDPCLVEDSGVSQYRGLDFADRIRQAAVAGAGTSLGFSSELMDMQCRLIERFIEELPAHQRNYQGYSGRLEEMTWVAMKLVSGARTQAELRQFFGFGGEGRIPKATAKLKFDQFDLGNYGVTSQDRDPGTSKADKKTAPRSAARPRKHQTTAARTSRTLKAVEGEVSQSLFARRHDLMVLLAGDPLSVSEVARATGLTAASLRPDLELAVGLGLLRKKGRKYLAATDDFQFKHLMSASRSGLESMLRYIGEGFGRPGDQRVLVENLDLKVGPDGIGALKSETLAPLLYKKVAPLTDGPKRKRASDPYEKEMFALVFVATDRATGAEVKLEDRIVECARQAAEQRATATEKERAVFLSATMMMHNDRVATALSETRSACADLRKLLPAEGDEPDLNVTVLFTPVTPRYDAGSEDLGSSGTVTVGEGR